jgi:hypothetical protein
MVDRVQTAVLLHATIDCSRYYLRLLSIYRANTGEKWVSSVLLLAATCLELKEKSHGPPLDSLLSRTSLAPRTARTAILTFTRTHRRMSRLLRDD